MIYLDHAAATPVSRKATLAMQQYFSDQFFNPSAPYLPAKHVRDNYEYAKGQIAHSIGAKGADLIIASGATESINLAFTAVKAALMQDKAVRVPERQEKNQSAVLAQKEVKSAPRASETAITPEILVLSTEHSAVLSTAEHIVTEVSVKLKFINVDKNGLILLPDLREKLTGNTVFVSVSLANNELGTIQPLAEIAEILRKERENRLRNGNRLSLFLHSDASQALNLIDISVSRLGVDLLTINSAKIGGPKGVGALYASHEVKLLPLIYGGGQEAGLRSGTENVPGVVGFAAAAEEAKEHVAGNRKKYAKMAEILRKELSACQITPLFLGNPKHQLANFVPVSFPGVDAERIIYLLEESQVYLSTGAACSANKGTVSHVLQAIGLSTEEIAGSLRISLGVLNTEENVREAGKLIVAAVEQEARRCQK